MNNDHSLTAIKDRLAGVRDSLGEAYPGIPASEIIARARGRRVRRRMVSGASGVLALAAAAAVAVTVLLPASHPAATGPALVTAYVVHRVEDAITNDDKVMRQTRSLDDPSSGGGGFFDGQPSTEQVTWAYQGRNRTEIFGTHGQLQGTTGTGRVSGKLQGVEVDYIRHQWGLIPGMFYETPVNACNSAGFLDAPGDPGTNWPRTDRANPCLRRLQNGWLHRYRRDQDHQDNRIPGDRHWD